MPSFVLTEVFDQYIDAIGLKARNVESISIGGIIKFENSVEAELQV